MKKKAKRKTPAAKNKGRFRLSPSAWAALALGTATTAGGVYAALGQGSAGGWFVAGLGLVVYVLVWQSYRR
ncbi:MAG: hypothetical protein JRI97_04030 [Deltaproteobacteria bacterium]|nr:hypothetical protein [Deltaproteobacteria bacterium]